MILPLSHLFIYIDLVIPQKESRLNRLVYLSLLFFSLQRLQTEPPPPAGESP